MRRLTIAVAGLLICAGTPLPAVPGQAAPGSDVDDVEIHSLHVQGNVWMLVGGPSNAAVSIGDDGVLIVDTMVEPLADKLLAEVRRLAGDKPIRHRQHPPHPDHTGGTAYLRRLKSIVAGNFAAQVSNAPDRRDHRAREDAVQNAAGCCLSALPTNTFSPIQDIFFNGKRCGSSTNPPAIPERRQRLLPQVGRS
jgi:glyoxylase-like metal-dependent hydrolase (beta-lactamase superfamily II)